MENPSLTGRSERRSGAFLGPAVSPRLSGFRATLLAPAPLLPPFVRPGRRPPTPPADPPPLLGLAPETAIAAPWEAESLLDAGEILFPERQGEAAPRALDALGEPEELEVPEVPEVPEAPEMPAPEEFPPVPETVAGTAVASSARREAVAAPAEHPEPVHPLAVEVGEGAAMEEIAGRLERIARALREGRPIELFAAGASDPLEVLIAGYALGYSEAFRRQAEERRQGR